MKRSNLWRLKSLLLLIGVLITAQSANATPLVYTFEGTLTAFRSYNGNYDINDFGLVVGRSHLAYSFLIDFDVASSRPGTFYTELLSGSLINGDLDYQYGDFYQYGSSHLFNGVGNGVISNSPERVKISTTSNVTPDWRVEDWVVGQSFRSQDLGCFSGWVGGCAVYAFGDVTLTDITNLTVDEPQAWLLLGFGLLFLGLAGGVREYRRDDRNKILGV